MKSTIKAIIFDLDGTLLDTLDDIADSMNHVLKVHGLPEQPVEAFKLFIGDGVTNLVSRAAMAAEADKAGLDFAKLETEYRAEYELRQADKTAPYDGVPELVKALSERGIKMAVLSNKPHEATVQIIKDYFPGIFFDSVLGQSPGRPVKPDPSGALEILDALGVPRREIIYLGDSGTDMRLAKAVGIMAVGALWGFRGRTELTQNGADAFAEGPIDVLTFFE